MVMLGITEDWSVVEEATPAKVGPTPLFSPNGVLTDRLPR